MNDYNIEIEFQGRWHNLYKLLCICKKFFLVLYHNKLRELI